MLGGHEPLDVAREGEVSLAHEDGVESEEVGEHLEEFPACHREFVVFGGRLAVEDPYRSASVRRYSAGSIPSAARVTFSLNSGGNDSSVPDRATQSPAKSNTPAATWAEQFQRAAQSLPTTRM